MIFTAVALAFAAAFTGAAVYINLAEQPARLMLDDAALLAQCQPSYERAAPMQASLALSACALGAAGWLVEHRPLAFLGAILILAPWPVTLLWIQPVNNQLKAIAPQSAGPASRTLVRRWGHRHAIRGALGLAASTVFLAAPAN